MITSEWPTTERPEAVPFVVRQVEFLRRAGVDVEVFSFRGAKNPLNYLRAWREVRGKLRSKEYDVVHAQWGQSGLLALPTKTPLVVTFRGDDLEGIVGAGGRYTIAGRILRLLSRWIAMRADEVIVVSKRLVRHLARRSYSIIPSGLDLELFRPQERVAARKQLGLPLDKHLVLFAGDAANPRKRYELAKETVSRLDGEVGFELVKATGVPHPEIPIYMCACDALLLTSLHEGSPNVVKEALACNLPIVSVDVGDVKERISQIAGCEVCDEDDPAALAAALMRVLSRQERITGRERVRELDERVLTQNVVSVYKRAITAAGA